MNVALEILVMKESGEKCTSEDDLELDNEEAFRKKIENLCGLFVSIIDRKIYLIHQTAKEFLTIRNGNTSPQSPWRWKHTFTLEASHLEALKACLWYLQLEFPDSALDPRKGVPSSQLAQDHALLSYASINWTLHFQQAGEKADKELGVDALQLCDITSQRFVLWFRILEIQQRPRIALHASSDLIVACYFGLTTAVQLLVENKAKVDSKDDAYGQTPLSWAAENGYEAVVKLLLENKAEVDSKDKNDQTPLLWAAKNGYEAVVKLLFDNKAEVDSKDIINRTPLSWATENGHEAVVKLLLENKAEADSKDKYSQTPLFYATRNRNETVIKLLLENRAET